MSMTDSLETYWTTTAALPRTAAQAALVATNARPAVPALPPPELVLNRPFSSALSSTLDGWLMRFAPTAVACRALITRWRLAWVLKNEPVLAEVMPRPGKKALRNESLSTMALQ